MPVPPKGWAPKGRGDELPKAWRGKGPIARLAGEGPIARLVGVPREVIAPVAGELPKG